jgi:hypothetical protein
MHRLIQIIRALSPNCREAVRLQSDALDHRLSLVQRIGLRIHLMLCGWCSRYGRQIAFLRKMAQNIEHEHNGSQLTAEARKRMKYAIKIENRTEKIDKQGSFKVG